MAVYERFVANHFARGQVDFNTTPLKAMLVTSTYAYAATHEFRSDVTGEASGTGYTAGGVALTNVIVSDVADGDFMVAVQADDAVFASVTLSGLDGVIVYVDRGDPALDELVTYHEFSSTASATAEDFIVAWDVDYGFLVMML